MTYSFHKIKSRPDVFGFLFVIVLTAVLFLPVVSRAVVESADFQDHIRDARLWAEAGLGLDKAIRPHFFYHLLVIITHAVLPGGDWSTAAVITTTALYMLLGAIIYLLVRDVFTNVLKTNRAIIASVFVTIGLMLVSPITILTWNQQELYLGYLAIHVYHNPTQLALKPFALLLFLCVIRIFMTERVGPKLILATPLVGLASTLSKPSYAICIIPAVGLWTLYSLIRRRPIHWLLLIIGFGGSLGLVLLWQYLFHRSSMGGFAFRPFQVMDYYSPGTFPIKGIMSVVFPVCVYLIYFKKSIQNISLNLSWIAFLIGAVFTYLLIEPADWPSGNFLWSSQVTLLILFIISTLFVLRQYFSTAAAPDRKLDWRFYVCGGVWLLHLVSGILWYGIQLTQGMYKWW